jgi:RimK family alpha-L-glutamate ligase
MIAAGAEFGIEVTPMNIDSFRFTIDETNRMVWYYKGKKIKFNPDLVIDRMVNPRSLRETFRRYCDILGVRIVNRTLPYQWADDKIVTHMILSKKGIKSPDIMLIGPDFKFRKKIKFPVILKHKSKYHGKGTFLVNSIDEIKDIVGKKFQNYFIQEYIEESRGVDIRVHMANNRVVGAYKRTNIDGFLSNLKAGGKAEVLEKIPKDLNKLAIKVSKASRLDIVGIDFLVAKNGEYLVCEVNRTPGWLGFLDENFNLKVDFPRKIMREMLRIIIDREKRVARSEAKKLRING